MNKNNMMTVGTYIIGYENEDKESIKRAVMKKNMEYLRKIGINSMQNI